MRRGTGSMPHTAMQHIRRPQACTPEVQTVRAVLTLHKRSTQQPQQLHK